MSPGGWSPRSVRTSGLIRPPCPGWTVRDLVSHIVTGNRMFAGILRGDPPAAPAGSPAGEDLVTAYRDAASGLLAAFSEPGALEREVSVPFGTVPGIAALHLPITELLVHGWDLARATGRPASFPDDLAEQELAFTRARLGDIAAGRRPFGPPQPAAADAPAIDRLAACLGRTVAADAAGRPVVTALGSNVHIFARPRRREQLRWCFEAFLGCPATAVDHPGMPEPMLVVRFPGGGHLSIEFTSDAPDDDQPRLGAWLELRAGDPPAVMRAVLDAGLIEVTHPGHPYYFMAPGSPAAPGTPGSASAGSSTWAACGVSEPVTPISGSQAASAGAAGRPDKSSTSGAALPC